MQVSMNRCCDGPMAPARRLTELTVGGFIVTEASYGASVVLDGHYHAQATLTFVLEGGFREQVGNRTTELRARGMLVKPADAEHADRIGPGGARIIFIEATAERRRTIAEVFPALEKVRYTELQDVGRLGMRLHAALRGGGGPERLRSEGIILEMLAAVAEQPPVRLSGAPAWLRDVRDHLAANFAAPPTIAELASEAGVHPTYLARAFRRHYGVRPSTFAHQIRTEWAREAVISTTKSLAQIAAEAGFVDQSHFGRVFRSATGFTPGAYRRAYAPQSDCRPAGQPAPTPMPWPARARGGSRG